MSADLLLQKLAKVRQTGAGRWLAACPAHADEHPSLAIRETLDGTVLLHCFTGCSVDAILDAVDLEFVDLYPDHSVSARPERRPFNASDVLAALRSEALIVAAAGGKILGGEQLTDADSERLGIAVHRIRAAANYAGEVDYD